jgi:Domain of unknown function (DUF1772)
MTESTPIRIAQVIGLTGTAALAGVVFSFSGLLVPRILESPTPLLLRQWKHAFDVGKTRVPPLAGVCASSFLYLAYEVHKHNTPNVVPYKWKMYAMSALLTLGIVPYTLLIMQPTNRKLESKEKETRSLAVTDTIVEAGLGEETAHALVDKWATMNIGRAALLSLAAVLAAWATQK